MPDEFKNKIIDYLIEYLKEIKEKGTDCEIQVTPMLVDESKLVDGTMFAKRNLTIDITYNQLWTKNENELGECWKPYRKGGK